MEKSFSRIGLYAVKCVPKVPSFSKNISNYQQTVSLYTMDCSLFSGSPKKLLLEFPVINSHTHSLVYFVFILIIIL